MRFKWEAVTQLILTVFGKFCIDWHFEQKISLLFPADALQFGQILVAWQYVRSCGHRSMLADILDNDFLNILSFVLILQERTSAEVDDKRKRLG